jgi:hypothetical protein
VLGLNEDDLLLSKRSRVRGKGTNYAYCHWRRNHATRHWADGRPQVATAALFVSLKGRPAESV